MTETPDGFLSYSANFEDVILHRIFGRQPDGVFVDVGAADPTMENDCRALYDQGWSGVNVEPNPALHAALQRDRPRDRSFCCALGEQAGELLYHQVEGTGLSTLDAAEAERCRRNGWTVTERTVEVRTLGALLQEAGLERIDLLKVDVEGWEEPVLRGNDWERFRPSVILVEATLPERPERRDTGIAALLAQRGYRAAHFDGLNDFYVREDFRGADAAFATPPNVFDRFRSYRLRHAEDYARTLEESAASARRDGETERAARLRKEGELRAEQDRAAEQHRRADALARERDNLLAECEASRETMARDAHALIGERAELSHLRASLVRRERDCAAYAARLADTHREREELLILREQTRALHGAVAASDAAVVRLEHALHDAQAALGQARAALDRRGVEDSEAAAWIAAIRRSTSWRLTLPLRVGGRTALRVGRRVIRRG